MVNVLIYVKIIYVIYSIVFVDDIIEYKEQMVKFKIGEEGLLFISQFL